MDLEIIKRTVAEWEADNPVLAPNQLGMVVQPVGSVASPFAQSSKLGDGVTRWNDLPQYETRDLNNILGSYPAGQLLVTGTPVEGETLILGEVMFTFSSLTTGESTIAIVDDVATQAQLLADALNAVLWTDGDRVIFAQTQTNGYVYLTAYAYRGQQPTIALSASSQNTILTEGWWLDSFGSAPLTPEVINVSDTAYTLTPADTGKVLYTSSANPVTITVGGNESLPTGFTCVIVQFGTGTVSFTDGSITVYNRQTHTTIAGQYGMVSITHIGDGSAILAGDTAA